MIEITENVLTAQQLLLQDLIDLQQSIMETQYQLNKVSFIMNNLIDDYKETIGEEDV